MAIESIKNDAMIDRLKKFKKPKQVENKEDKKDNSSIMIRIARLKDKDE